jgi:hypothetical protein
MTIFGGVGASQTVGAASGGKVYAINDLSTTPQVVAPANQARKKITFHNPGTVDFYVAPSLVQTTGSDVALSPTTAALGGCLVVYSQGTLVIEGECQGAWQALSASGVDNPLTVIDTNV